MGDYLGRGRGPVGEENRKRKRGGVVNMVKAHDYTGSSAQGIVLPTVGQILLCPLTIKTVSHRQAHISCLIWEILPRRFFRRRLTLGCVRVTVKAS